jgi:hypothetical protein
VTHPQPLQRVQVLLDGLPVPGFEHCWSRDEQGNLWVRKRELHVTFPSIAAEIIGWHLARYLSVPVPDAAVYDDPRDEGSTSFLSKAIRPVVHWSSEKTLFVNNLEDLGNVLTLDAIL